MHQPFQHNINTKIKAFPIDYFCVIIHNNTSDSTCTILRIFKLDNVEIVFIRFKRTYDGHYITGQ